MALREILAKFGFEVDDAALKKANVNVDGLLGKITNLKGVIGGALAGVGLGFLKGQIDDLASEAGALNKAAIKSGVGFEQFQRIQYQTGLSTEQLTVSFRNLQLGMASAQGTANDANEDFASLAEGGLDKIGKKKAGDALKNLKVDLTDAKGAARSSGDVFQDTVTQLAALNNPAQQAALAVQIFGKSGSDILPLLRKSPEAIKALGEEFDLFGGITEESRQKLAEYGKEQKRLDLASKALRNTVLTALVPALTFLFQKVNEGLTWFKKNIDTSDLLAAALGVLTVAVTAFGWASAIAWAKALIGPALVAAGIALLIAVVDDLIHFFKGDAKTATEDLIKALFGFDVGSEIISEIRVGFQGWLIDIHRAQGALETLKAILGGIVDAIKFVTDPGKWSRGSGKQDATTKEDDEATLKRIREGGSSGGLFDRATTSIGDFFSGTKGGVDRNQAWREGRDAITVPLPGAQKAGPQTIDAKQNVVINQTINGADAKDAADQSAEGVKGVLKTNRQETLNALEVRR